MSVENTILWGFQGELNTELTTPERKKKSSLIS